MTSSLDTDILLVGGGIMSATLGTLLHQLNPELRITLVELQAEVATESSDGWNNAGTGHAGYCELNYTPQDADGSVPIARALKINAAFEESLQFWAWLVEKGILREPASFINPTPHSSFVWGEKNVAFLRKRHQALRAHHLFADMEYSQDPAVLQQWMPLVMAGRDPSIPVAATRVAYGSDVDFGSLTRQLVQHLQGRPGFKLLTRHAVTGLKQQGSWQVKAVDLSQGKPVEIRAGFVFLGAGGATLPLLQKSAIQEARGYGGFPVSGQWLVCHNPDVIHQHHAKVYGKAPLGAPPMSVPHLDTRIINGKPALLFGPFAGFTTRFLKRGSLLDLVNSVKRSNLKSMLGAGRHHMDLTRYLIGEVFQSHQQRMAALRNFYPLANESEWSLVSAGQRVQIIKQCEHQGGKLEFGTEIVSSADGSLAALLGASPGASTSVPAMLEVLQRCFSPQLQSAAWQERMREMLPSYGQSLIEDAELLRAVRYHTLSRLKLT
ncbi:malate dehydrogenase (quinone) [Methylobacillus flagellatus]|uniref:Probable malate:quinone oxidoreductase n=1 Tax=Methylobacillus flagellatus (strain ATCC 51484 / DSM 6875 / VKM B-1610 / KT) TaxID=265072 RepID=MQO_METFK|nr:malate dehydrogenase (quinone) [Methylobacillus flagellatus]Q1GXL1.1 RecName: Full=Probable malate:quinone oxidoreductase; AltName: Full=MQO; AltName: Full=Malate dehydrogenase [quinone] [Methylobacillus flagellatus KT]ABE48282.1 Malate dehydrogenase (acceptor) [Methylobacillus flagellatus KT]